MKIKNLKIGIMRKIVFTFMVLGAMALGVNAQDLSPKMSAFKDYCVRAANSAAVCDVDDLAACIENWEPGENGGEKFSYGQEDIVYIPFSDFTEEDVSQESIVGMHFGFMPAAVDSWITNKCEAVPVADANLLRAGDGDTHLEYSVRALKAGGRATYATRASGDIELFVVAENGGKVGLSVHAVEKDRSGNVTNETTLSDNSGGQVAQLKWSMDRSGKVEFTVENQSDKEISFVVVKNL